ncbi:hypothetical protein ACFOG5_10755 [Pedobacter fastidiosus]|uniref:Uncharacterized protein n=1 Tax=Pedobacter fastidiosus TaxID=2765361 RepID=A0ABR7KVU4_9SPHI|nr:hypothetical protein [Pedobacter fastidiosus]MBC6112156.1 hypothetical protein [Pedobacter fastidiosus]
MKPIKVVLITSGQPSVNPRLVKEADALSEAGYDVVVIYQYYNDWATVLDQKLLETKLWKAILVSGAPQKNKFRYLKSRFIHKIAKKITAWTNFKLNFSLLSIGRETTSLISESEKNQADLYIAHNLAALPAAVIAAKKNKAKCGFDAEDFHRNEVSNSENDFDVKLKTKIENRFLNQIDYLTTSSDQIGLAYQSIYPNLNPLTILNVFPPAKIAPKEKGYNGLKLFWFSQTVGKGRGLEDVFKALAELNELDIELHLLGNYDLEIQLYFKKFGGDFGFDHKKITFHSPISSDDIVSFASSFDIGLATETGNPRNRDLCLTNKLFTYLSAGLAIILTDTMAQKAFMKKYSDVGSIYPIDDYESLKDIISLYYNNRILLKETQINSLDLANSVLNWETEKSKFLSLVKSIIYHKN